MPMLGLDQLSGSSSSCPSSPTSSPTSLELLLHLHRVPSVLQPSGTPSP
jgi:hypothetical protein